MPVDLNRNFAFIHIPKTGGTSIEKALGINGDNKCMYGYSIRDDSFYQHWYASNLRSIFGEQKYKEMFKFSFVRNPYTRMMSEFFYLKRLGSPFVQDLDINDFVSRVEYCMKFGMHTIPREARQHLEPQSIFIKDSKGNMIIDFLGRFENLELDFKNVCNRIGVNTSLEVHEKSSNKNNLSLYSKSSLETIKNIYKEDFERFGYE